MDDLSLVLRKSYRTIWISDIHLGSYGCKAEHLLNFLENIKCNKIYLVGDIMRFHLYSVVFVFTHSLTAGQLKLLFIYFVICCSVWF